MRFIFTLLCFASFGAYAQDALLHDTWRSAVISDHGGFLRMKVVMRFAADQSCLLRIDAQLVHPLGSKSSRDDFECTYTTAAPNKLDMTFTRLVRTMMDSAAVSDANDSAECGINTWQIGVPRDISQASCDADEDDLHVGSEIKTIYQLEQEGNQLYLGLDFMTGSAGPVDAESRDSELSRRVALARTGHDPLPVEVPTPQPDVLSGLYRFTSSFTNPDGCDSVGAPQRDAPSYFYIYPSDNVMPGTEGLLARECNGRAGCDRPGSLLLTGAWAFGDEIVPGREWRGEVSQSTGRNQCRVKQYRTKALRAEDGSLALESRLYEVEVAVPDRPNTDRNPCGADHPLVRQALAQATCRSLRTITLARE